jgi:hypothetical protein
MLPAGFQLCSYQWRCPTTGVSLSARFGIDVALADSIEKRFGVPPHMQVGGNQVRIGGQDDLRLLSARGIVVDGMGLRVDYSGIASGSASVLVPLAQHLISQVGVGADTRAKVAAIVGLAQATRYEIPEDSEDGTGKLSFRTPLAMLARGAGDCDSKVCLAAAMIRSVGLAKVALVSGRQHALLGVAIPTRSGDAAIGLDGTTFVVTEATALVPIGSCGSDEVAYGSAFRALAI